MDKLNLKGNIYEKGTKIKVTKCVSSKSGHITGGGGGGEGK
jgi:hypothetical protein